MTPDIATAMLDRALATYGTTCTLRRYVGLGDDRVASDITVLAHVRDYDPEEMVGGIIQGDTHIILSPSPLIDAAWPGPLDWPAVGDTVMVEGRLMRVESAPRKRVAGEVVRIELQARG